MNGTVYEGDFANGVSNGNGKLTRADGTVIEGYFENGVLKKGF